ncbi:hypothetical protein BN7_5419 [Wickerhamomyces ciferrii]|uniref:Protein kinase domain-containing protein n=1 Tax=Wickerhamomyces ciferrii (strain ATCC 14091 / BCRC 22168 / CBS 111 / JCM 3599 / NBRC 0793 / NRRL Y-1031 F-60-10) TaxID=1206466 RepID=K0KXQ0_WICCF|nr:uncharacterized protein BN7_5419 [Wickerhamomyces ciferrii]CCH45833.1 hypothetical protein BN7_5419 [Wickerhamomyces ciferrii]
MEIQEEKLNGNWYQKKLYKIAFIIPELVDICGVDGDLNGNFTTPDTFVQHELHDLNFEQVDDISKSELESNAVALEQFVEETLATAEGRGKLFDINNDLFSAIGRSHGDSISARSLQYECVGQSKISSSLKIITVFFSELMQIRGIPQYLSTNIAPMNLTTEDISKLFGIQFKLQDNTKMSLGNIMEDLGIVIKNQHDTEDLPTSILSLESRDQRLGKFIRPDKFPANELSSILKKIMICTLLRGNSSFILSDYVTTRLCLLPIHEKNKDLWLNKGKWITLKAPVKSHFIDSTTPFDKEQLSLCGLFALVTFDGIFQKFGLLNLDEYSNYLKLNEAKKMNEQNQDWMHFFREFLLNSMVEETEYLPSLSSHSASEEPESINDSTNIDSESLSGLKRPSTEKISETLPKKTRIARSTKESNNHSHYSNSWFVDLKDSFRFKGLDDSLIIPNMSTYACVKFVLPQNMFLRLLDNKLQSKRDANKISKQIIQQGTEKIFWKFYDLQGNIARLKIYGHNYFGDYVATGLSEADRYTLGNIEDFDSLESINEIAKADYDNEVETLRGIYRYNATLKNNEKDFIINTTQAYCHGEVLANTMEGRIYQGYHIAYNYIDFAANKPKTKSQFKSWKTQIDNLHKAGFHHGDIHPRNVACRDDGEVFIYDFGRSEQISEMEGYWKQKCLNKTCTDYIELEEHRKAVLGK